MTFLQACVLAAKKATEEGKTYYVHEAPTYWSISALFSPDWLFRAYPGGRKQMTEAGAKLAEIEGVDVRI